MKIVVRDDAGNDYDVNVKEGASIAYAVEQASKQLGFKVKHVEPPADDGAATVAALKHTEHLLKMESLARERAENSVSRETARREEAEDALSQVRVEMDRARERETKADRARAEAVAKASSLDSALSLAKMEVASLTASMEEADRRHTAILEHHLEESRKAFESERASRLEAEKRCTTLAAELKRAAPAAPKGWVLDIEGVDFDRPRRRARLSPEKSDTPTKG